MSENPTAPPSVGFKKRNILLAVLALTGFLVLLFPDLAKSLTNNPGTSVTAFFEHSVTVVEPGGSTVESKVGSPPKTNSLSADSYRDDILKPPSQEWAQKQVLRTVNMMHQHYSKPSEWEVCGAKTYYFHEIKTIYTGIPKTGCSNWIEALLRANGDLKHQLDPTMVRKVHGGISGRHRIPNLRGRYDPGTLRQAFSFTVVRNPWTRMVSGYRDKVSAEKTQGGSFRSLGRAIVREMRNITDRAELAKLYPTFTEFAQWVAKHHGSGNPHFHQQYRTLCIPRAKYDFIIPLEYAGPLSQEVWRRINAETSLLQSYDKSSDPRLQKSALYAKDWLSKIDKETIDKLYKIFELDFALMKYSNFTDPNFPLPLHDLNL